MKINAVECQIRQDTQSRGGLRRWVMTANPCKEQTLELTITHDWSGDPDEFVAALYKDEGDCYRLVEDMDAYREMCEEHDSEVPDNVIQMTDTHKQVIEAMKERWTALNLIAHFAF